MGTTRLPERIWVCPSCGQFYTRRWVLKRHLMEIHGLPRDKAQRRAEKSEFWLHYSYNPADPDFID